ncbi:(2Fe-2S)-binding protein [Jiangella endophytica]|uniref:(2Fe-2S)-binding protein n=1 Tax=Jiangella endophytica TaxID=1623398 RepID=UPI000E35102E|nr:(2Fe-2S)-binding protein [Jiangella endophytica]
MCDMEAAVRLVRDRTPTYVLRVGAEAGGRPTSDLRRPDVTTALVDELGHRIGTGEARVAVSTLFLGYAARLWCLALGTAELTGRSLDLDPDVLGWSSSAGTLTLHCSAPRPGGTPAEEVVDRQLGPLAHAWSRWIAPGALWGNAASAARGAGTVLGPAAMSLAEEALAHPLLANRLDPNTHRRASCCLFYRARPGGYCGDCPLTPHQGFDGRDRSSIRR